MPLPSARWSPVPLLLRHATGHSRGTDSRHQAARGGHRRTSRSGNLSSGGHLGSRRDTGGHATNTVRDREAPGSNPGPPTSFLNSKFGADDIRRGDFGPGDHREITDLPKPQRRTRTSSGSQRAAPSHFIATEEV